MTNSLVDLISEKAEALVVAPDDFNSLVDLIGDARFVLTGEASSLPYRPWRGCWRLHYYLEVFLRR
jgi:hypothetical protein